MTDTLSLFAAGSLKAAMSDITDQFREVSEAIVTTRFGAAGGLRERIQSGDFCDVFASANMEHPILLRDAGRAEEVVRFAGNSLCAVLRPGLSGHPTTLEDLLQKKNIRIGISTPVNDPCGDYAVRLLEKLGVDDTEEKIIVVTGGREEKASRKDGLSDYSAALHGQADLVLLYRTSSTKITREVPGSTIVTLPPLLEETVHYGITATKPSSPIARDFIDYVLGGQGQATLSHHGFLPAEPLRGDRVSHSSMMRSSHSARI